MKFNFGYNVFKNACDFDKLDECHSFLFLIFSIKNALG